MSQLQHVSGKLLCQLSQWTLIRQFGVYCSAKVNVSITDKSECAGVCHCASVDFGTTSKA